MTVTLFLNQLRSGAFNLIIVALILAATTASCISLITSAIGTTISERATHLLAADVQIQGSWSAPADWLEKADQLGLSRAQAVSFRAMVFNEEQSQIVAVKAVSNRYPLKGAIELRHPNNKATQGPAPGQIFAPKSLLNGLSVDVGDSVAIGDAQFVIAAELGREPDNLRGGFGFAPTLLMHLNDLPKTAAVQPGSRIQSTLYLAGDTQVLAQYRLWVNDKLGKHFTWNTVAQANRGVVDALDKANQFIFLGIIAATLLSGIAIGLGTRKYALSQIQATAILKTLGWGPKKVFRLHLLTIQLLGITGIVPGLLLGSLCYWLLRQWLVVFIPDIRPANLHSFYLAGATAYLTFLAFAAPYFLRLHRISPLQALRETHNHKMLNNRWALIMGFGCLALIGTLYSGRPALVGYLFLAITLCYLGNALIAYGISFSLHKLPLTAAPTWLLGSKNLFRHRHQNIPQIAMFSMLFTLIFTMVLMRTSLISQWQLQLPENTPNYFAFNIFNSEKADLQRFFAEQKIAPRPFYPMIRARVVGHNQIPLSAEPDESQRGINYQREMNVTWSTQMGSDNKLIAGEFWPKNPQDGLHASIEQSFAQGLQMALGDQLQLSAEGKVFFATVVSIRQVRWDSMNPNFFIILNRPPESYTSANWLTSFHLDAVEQKPFYAWLREHPTVTVVEIEQTIALIQEIIRQVSLTIEFIGALVIVTGLVVLVASIQLSLDMRQQESALMRVLGAKSSLVRSTLALESFITSAIASVLACISTELAVNLVGKNVFNLELAFHPWLWLSATAIMVPLIAGLSLLTTRHTLNTPPLTALRNLHKYGG